MANSYYGDPRVFEDPYLRMQEQYAQEQALFDSLQAKSSMAQYEPVPEWAQMVNPGKGGSYYGGGAPAKSPSASYYGAGAASSEIPEPMLPLRDQAGKRQFTQRPVSDIFTTFQMEAPRGSGAGAYPQPMVDERHGTLPISQYGTNPEYTKWQEAQRAMSPAGMSAATRQETEEMRIQRQKEESARQQRNIEMGRVESQHKEDVEDVRRTEDPESPAYGKAMQLAKSSRATSDSMINKGATFADTMQPQAGAAQGQRQQQLSQGPDPLFGERVEEINILGQKRYLTTSQIAELEQLNATTGGDVNALRQALARFIR